MDPEIGHERESDLLHDVIDALLAGTPVNWAAADAAASPDERLLLRHFQSIASVTRPGRTAGELGDTLSARAALVYRLILTLAALKALLGLAAAAQAVATAAPGSAPWPYVTNVTVFGVAAGVLWWSARDWCGRSLGAFFLLIASAFSDRLLLTLTASPALEPIVHALRRLTLDAFLPFALWLFIWFFPAPPLGRRDRWLTRLFLGASLTVSCLLVSANLFLGLQPHIGALPILSAIAAALDRQSSSSYYSLLQFVLAVPALPYLLWKSRFEALEHRRRTALFTVPLVVGIAPMILAVVISPFIGFFDDPANRRAVAPFLYLALLSVVPLTAHAVLVRRVMDIDLLITTAMRHMFVRRVAWLAAIVPFVALAAYVYLNRTMTVTEIVWTQTTLLFLPGVILALLLAAFHQQLSQAIDRRFLVAPPSYPEVLARLERGFRDARGVQEVAALLTQEADRAVHPKTTAVLVPDGSGRRLVSLTGAPHTLPMDSMLAQLLGLARDEVYAGVDATGPVGRLLPEEDRTWLRNGHFQLLLPMLGSAGDLLGVIVVGEKRNGQRFLKDDRLLLATIAGQAAVVLENRALRDEAFQHLLRPAEGQGAIHWDDEPGALCGVCRTMWPAQTRICACGQATAPAALPLVIRGKFRVQRLIGSGGMGVVYQAIDIALDRKVAIKTLPRLTTDRILRLQREARAMAAVSHPNLAVIFGVESWRGAPLLLAEYLEGGTLADRLASGPLHWADAITLGIVLADVLDKVHASGVLHRDIKPSNVGFTREGAPKLLDFGIAVMHVPSMSAVVEAPRPPVAGRELSVDPALRLAATAVTGADRLVGTPLYLSPEALAEAEPDTSFDLWSLSLVLFESVAGRNPFHGATIGDVADNIRRGPAPDILAYCAECPPALATFFTAALAPDRAERPRSAGELRTWLQELRARLTPG